jgi:hypothetical protein
MPYTKDTLDTLRADGEFGDGTNNPILVTPGAADVIGEEISGIFFEFMNFENWDPNWDSDDLHEIGIIDFDGTDIMFKITPADLKNGTFSLTFMLPTEW